MTAEVFAFFVLAASLVLVGFVSGPLVVRHVSNEAHRQVGR